MNNGDNMEKEIENLYFISKDVEQFYKLKLAVLNSIVWEEGEHVKKEYFNKYIKMLFKSYEKRIFADNYKQAKLY